MIVTTTKEGKKEICFLTEISNDSLADLSQTSNQQLKNKTRVSTSENTSFITLT